MPHVSVTVLNEKDEDMTAPVHGGENAYCSSKKETAKGSRINQTIRGGRESGDEREEPRAERPGDQHG